MLSRDLLPKRIQEWRELREERLQLEREVREKKVEESALKSVILEALKGYGYDTEGLVVEGYVTGIQVATGVRINDWQALKRYIIEQDAFDVLSLQLSKAGVKDCDKPVPGVETYTTVSLYNRKV